MNLVPLVSNEPKPSYQCHVILSVGDTGFEPVTSAV